MAFLQSLIIAEVSRLYDESIWVLRDQVRDIEKGFNVVVQRDSKETVEISRLSAITSNAARIDSASMKTIAVVTLAFLPATFVCTIFSMSFFTLNVNDETGHKHWLISEKFWIYSMSEDHANEQKDYLQINAIG
ncbi:hypothetical protein H2200_013388 [Cladophialophora chaetospira]|uniref:Uncharacterized protein n=1 Tax=Cladophialophora chaetospira TaxID=386627 RepID=A0AA38TXE5_9EURO|nr:hypothetical protein H2200_013388 [Cladophialophora chaetospira]